MKTTMTRLVAAATGILAAGTLSLPLQTATAEAGRAPECTNSDLHASYRGGDAAMSHTYGRIVLRNVSDHRCFVEGYGGLSYVGGGDGTQIGAAAERTPSRSPRIVLAPGRRVVSPVVETSYAPFPRHKCRPAHVDGFRVYVPDSTEAQFIKHPTTGCRNHKVHLISHKAYRRP
jgi:hypothetical protein